MHLVEKKSGFVRACVSLISALLEQYIASRTVTREAEFESENLINLVEITRVILKPETNANFVHEYIDFNLKMLKLLLNEQIKLGEYYLNSL